MTTRDAETLAQLVAEHAGTGRELTFAQLSERCVDPDSGYRPSPNLLWKIASGQKVKPNEPLVFAIAAGLSLSRRRVQAAAARQFLGWSIDDPFGFDPGDDDAVVRVAHAAGLSAGDLPAVRAFIDEVRRRTPEVQEE